ncbi:MULTISPECIES: hypothetical protein [Bacillota]|uniref:Uncharacterized protein n=2 Tax=Enterocloster clostridioformis TaxID=1531 RepID=A0A174T8L6_9FIRM|nr:hypothetical protein [Enterocloster clostridioformis]CUQ04841.1 Uncharacterised protein [Enterocloster clostridioformis]
MDKSCIAYLMKQADDIVSYICEHSFAPAGMNGPYDNNDTELRNSAHWLIVFLYLKKQFNQNKYDIAITKLLTYLQDEANYGSNGAPLCRKDDNIDNVNGLIGPAWIAEAFIYVYKITGEKKYIKKAQDILCSTVFNPQEKMWEIVDTNGKNWGIDRTLNHQVWYAAICMELLHNGKGVLQGSERLEDEIRQFLDRLPHMLRIYPNGVFMHIALTISNIKYVLKYFIKALARFISGKIENNSKWDEFYQLEEGYLSFDVYGFAIIKQYAPELALFNSKKFVLATKLCQEKKFISKLIRRKNKYSFPYNSPLYEYGFIRNVFKNASIDTIGFDELYNYQKAALGNQEKYDKNTLNARCYEMVRFLESEDNDI